MVYEICKAGFRHIVQSRGGGRKNRPQKEDRNVKLKRAKPEKYGVIGDDGIHLLHLHSHPVAYLY